MLELLVGLARRMGFLIGNENDPSGTAQCFWQMIGNLGLRPLTDENWIARHGEFRVEDAVHRILDRTYEPTGEGGLFPIPEYIHAHGGDARNMEIWYQMQIWMGLHSGLYLDI